ncbi:putative glucose-6-phosphate 1-epimerase isoform X2 [Lolium rigidum]|uniref:putative glucose-6-phosphate 1-epimerase isoform X2 n=1 Tax=Lolium rigidum TaxID=89674 RepID=UPI001F5CC1B4|nr:putative glucose-6-phosphate 1-epimerase isoform X2 [Lolium rigidum]
MHQFVQFQGVPLKFGSNGNLEQHGFARNRLWTIDDNPPPLPVNPSIKAFVDIILKPNEDDLKIWPHSFEFGFRIALDALGDLSLTSDGRPFPYTFAYHTNFSVSDIRFLVIVVHVVCLIVVVIGL